MALALKVLLGIICTYTAIVAVLYVFQDRLIYFPQMGRHVVTTPAASGIAYDDLTIRTEDGETLNVWWVPAPDRRGVVLLLPGNAGNISQRVEYALMFR